MAVVEVNEPAVVGAAVRARRLKLNMKQDEAVAASGGLVSKSVWSMIENGRQHRYKDLILPGVARSLKWPQDWLERIQTGEQLNEDVAAERVASADLEAEIAELREEIRQITLQSRLFMLDHPSTSQAVFEATAESLLLGDASPVESEIEDLANYLEVFDHPESGRLRDTSRIVFERLGGLADGIEGVLTRLDDLERQQKEMAERVRELMLAVTQQDDDVEQPPDETGTAP